MLWERIRSFTSGNQSPGAISLRIMLREDRTSHRVGRIPGERTRARNAKARAAPAPANADRSAAKWRPNALQRLVAAYLIIVTARLDEIVPALYRLHVIKLLVIVLVVMTWMRPQQLLGRGSLREWLPKRALWFILISTCSVAFSIYKSYSLTQVLTVVIPASVGAIYMWRSVGRLKDLEYYLKAFEIAGLLLVAIALMNYNTGRLDLGSGDNLSYDTNDLAYVLATILPLTIGLAAIADEWPRRIMHAAAAVVLIVSVLLTQSRGGFLAMLIVPVQIIAVMTSPRSRSKAGSPSKGMSRSKLLVVTALVGIGALVIWNEIPGSAQSRILSVFSTTNDYNLDMADTTGRLSIWDRGIDAILDRPIGYGIGTFSTVDGMRGGRYKAAHNSVLEVAVELGVLGLLLYLAMLRAAFQGLGSRKAPQGTRAPGQSKLIEREIVRSLRFALLANVVAGFFLTEAYSDVFWMLLGTIAGAQSLMANDGGAAPDARAVK